MLWSLICFVIVGLLKLTADRLQGMHAWIGYCQPYLIALLIFFACMIVATSVIQIVKLIKK